MGKERQWFLKNWIKKVRIKSMNCLYLIYIWLIIKLLKINIFFDMAEKQPKINIIDPDTWSQPTLHIRFVHKIMQHMAYQIYCKNKHVIIVKVLFN